MGMLPLGTYLWFLIFEEIFQILARRFASKGAPCGIYRGKLTGAATSGAARSSEHLFYINKYLQGTFIFYLILMPGIVLAKELWETTKFPCLFVFFLMTQWC